MKKIIKKILLTFLCVFILSSLCASERNLQKIWTADCQLFKYISILYLAEGKGLPNSSGPWSGAELVDMIECLSGEYESKELSKLYQEVVDELNKENRVDLGKGIDANWKGELSPEFYIHSNSYNFNTNEDWTYGYKERKEFVSLETDFLVSDWFYGYGVLGLGYAAIENDFVLYGKNFASNIPYVAGADFSKISLNFPNRVLVAAGGDHWSFSAGRDVLKWGNGETGNLFLGGNQKYDNGLRFSAFSDLFKFSFVSIFYPHSEDVLHNGSQFDTSLHGFNMYMAHKFEFSLLDKKLNLGLSEGVIYQSPDGTLDVRIFNPLMVYHNYFIRANANSILGFDADYTFFDGFNVYGQVVLDETAFLGEPGGKDSEPWRPSKYGFLAGVKYVFPAWNGIFKLNFEGVYTDPCLYLREKYDETNQKYGVSFYGHLREYSMGGDTISFIRECIGYKYGGDAVVASLKAEYFLPKTASISSEIFYMAHGIMKYDLGDDWITGKKTNAPSKYDQTGIENPSGEIQHVLRISFSGDYHIFDNLKVYAGLDNVFIWNKNNRDLKGVADFQFHTGLSFTF